MMKKTAIRIGWVIGAVLATLAVGLLVAAIIQGSNSAGPQTTSTETGIAETLVETPLPDLKGEWSAQDNGAYFDATIVEDSIRIRFVNGDTSMIYWNGTFNSQSASGVTLVSNRIDLDEIILSGSPSKDFLIENNTISFEFKAMGMTKMVVLTRA